jgi:hypothetical protein
VEAKGGAWINVFRRDYLIKDILTRVLLLYCLLKAIFDASTSNYMLSLGFSISLLDS